MVHLLDGPELVVTADISNALIRNLTAGTDKEVSGDQFIKLMRLLKAIDQQKLACKLISTLNHKLDGGQIIELMTIVNELG